MSTQRVPRFAAADGPGVVVRSLRSRIDEMSAAGNDTTQLQLDLGVALLGQGRHSEAVHELENLARDHDIDARRRASAAAILAGALVLAGRPDDGRRAAESALASHVADVDAQVLAHSALRALEFFAGRYELAVAHARRTAGLASHSGPGPRAEARLDLGGMLAHADAFDEALDSLALEDDAPSWLQDEALEARALVDLASGRWNAMLDALPPGSGAADRDRSDVSRVLRPALRTHALIHLDRIDEARREWLIPPHQVAPPKSRRVRATRRGRW